MQGIIWTFYGTLFTFSVTALGALNVFLMRNSQARNMQSVIMGFAGGVMVAASVWSLLLPGIECAKALNQISWLVTTAGFLFGMLLLLFLDRLLRKRMDREEQTKHSLTKSTVLLVLAITAHNIPEGMAVGLGFALAASERGNPALLSGAVALAIGIGIQNYPEGTAVALPLIRDGMSRKKAFWIGTMSAIVEPIFGLLAALLAAWVIGIMPLLLSFAAGAMIYVVVQELIPQANQGEDDTLGTIGFMGGFLIMMILDVALG